MPFVQTTPRTTGSAARTGRAITQLLKATGPSPPTFSTIRGKMATRNKEMVRPTPVFENNAIISPLSRTCPSLRFRPLAFEPKSPSTLPYFRPASPHPSPSSHHSTLSPLHAFTTLSPPPSPAAASLPISLASATSPRCRSTALSGTTTTAKISRIGSTRPWGSPVPPSPTSRSLHRTARCCLRP